MLERERREKIIDLIEQVLPLLDDYEKAIFELYVLGGKTFEETGRELSRHKSSIYRKVMNMNRKIRKCCEDFDTLVELRAYIVDNPSTKEAKPAVHHLGWNTERLSKYCTGAKWGKVCGYFEYKPTYKCLIDTYTDAVCTLCGVRCHNSVNKERWYEANREAV